MLSQLDPRTGEIAIERQSSNDHATASPEVVLTIATCAEMRLPDLASL